MVESVAGGRWHVNAASLQLLNALESASTLDEVADRLASQWGCRVPVERLRQYIDDILVRNGLIERSDSSLQDSRSQTGYGVRAVDSLLFRMTLIPSGYLRMLSSPLTVLFAPRFFWVAFAIAAVVMPLLLYQTLSSQVLSTVLTTPSVLLVALLSTLIHELGHAAACSRFRCTHGSLGFGLYLVFPVLYMELHEIWRLPRLKRAIVDGAGIYFQLLFTLGLIGLAQLLPQLQNVAEGSFVLIVLWSLVSLNPMFRFDGYWLLSDLAGIPNLRRRSFQAARAYAGRLRARTAGAPDLPAQRPVPSRWNILLVIYAALSISVFAYFSVWLATKLPNVLWETYPRLFRMVMLEVGLALRGGSAVSAAGAIGSLLTATLWLTGIALLARRILVGLVYRGARACWRRYRHVSQTGSYL
jgi:putative peptide zinc metalloprotease protein